VDLSDVNLPYDFSAPITVPNYAAGEFFSALQVRLPLPSRNPGFRRLIVSAVWPGPNPSPDPAAETDRTIGLIRGPAQGLTGGNAPFNQFGGRGLILPMNGQPVEIDVSGCTSVTIFAVQPFPVSITLPADQTLAPGAR
jgi:hypothetical protein